MKELHYNCQHCRKRFLAKIFNYRYCEETPECKEAGNEAKNALIKKAMEKAKEKTKIKASEEIKETQNAKIDLLSDDAFRAKKIQPVINEIARLIDFQQPCIATGRTYGKMAGGHFISVGANRASALNLHNIHLQCYESNGPSGGDPLLYRSGIIKTYGLEYCEFIESMREIAKLGLKRFELEQIHERAKMFRIKLKKDLKKLSNSERIEKRNEANEFINVYDKKYSQFNPS